MFISDKAALNAAVRDVREQLCYAQPSIFTALRFNSLHQIIARLCGYRTQASLLDALPTSVTPDLTQIPVELFRTWSVEHEDDRTLAVETFYGILSGWLDELLTSPKVLLQVDFLFGVSPVADMLTKDHFPNCLARPIDWRTIIKSSTGLNVVGALCAQTHNWEPEDFLGRENEYQKTLNGAPIEMYFHELISTSAFFGDLGDSGDASLDRGWGPEYFVRSCLLLATVEEAAKVDNASYLVDSGSLPMLARYFQCPEVKDLDDADFDCGSHLLTGRITTSPLPLIHEFFDLDQFQEQGSSVRIDEQAIWSSEADDLAVVPLIVALENLPTPNEFGERELALHEWATECFVSGEVDYPQFGISITVGDTRVGFLGRWLGQTMLALQAYERTWSPDAMSVSSNSGFGAKLFNAQRDIALYCFDSEEDDVWSDLTDSVFHLSDGHMPSYLNPPYLGKFSESIKHLPPTIEPSYDASKPAFERMGRILINEYGVNQVKVDDFLNPDNDMTTAMIVGLYQDDLLLAEFSYSVLKQNPKGTACAELELDQVIQQWCRGMGLPAKWNEHSVIRPTGERCLSRFEDANAFLPVLPSDHAVNGCLCVTLAFENSDTLTIDAGRLEQAMTHLFKHCVTGVEPFEFRVLPEDALVGLSPSAKIADLKAVIAEAFKQTNTFTIRTSRERLIVGGYNMRGTSLPEISESVTNTWITHCDFDGNNSPLMKPEATIRFMELLGVPESKRVRVRIDFPSFSAGNVFSESFL